MTSECVLVPPFMSSLPATLAAFLAKGFSNGIADLTRLEIIPQYCIQYVDNNVL